MKLISNVIPLAALFSVASAAHVPHGKYYDHWWNSPSKIDCFGSLISPLHGLTDFHNVKTWPFIGGSDTVGLSTRSCGSCWQISYEGKSVNITAVDTASDGFDLSGRAMEALTNDKDADVEASATQIDKGYCKL